MTHSGPGEIRVPRAVAFDVVGTLIYASPPVDVVYHQAAVRNGSKLGRIEIRERFQKALETDFRPAPCLETSRESAERDWWRIVVSRVLPDIDTTLCFDDLFDHFAQPQAWRCFEDVGETVTAIRAANLPLALATNFDARLHSVCAGLPPLDSIVHRVVSSELGIRKPDAEFFQAVSRSLATKSADILFVGDDLKNDFEGSSAAGLSACHLDRNGHYPSHRNRIRRLTDLIPALKNHVNEEPSSRLADGC